MSPSATREQQFALNALNRIADVIAAVRELPGRKTVLLVSEGFSMPAERLAFAMR